MNYKKTLLIFGAAGLFVSQAAIIADMQPVKKDGRYYYNNNDTYVHVDLKRALSILVKKILAPQDLVKGLVSKFYPSPSEKKEKIDPIAILKPIQTVPAAYSIEPRITWIGHATFLIQMDGFNILTDPIFGSVKVGPFTLTERAIPAGIQFEDLPHIDAVVISHDHSDHMDTTALIALAKKCQPTVFVPEGNKTLVESMGLKHVVEHSWGDDSTLTKEGRSLTITCLPAYHWSCRFSLGSYRKSLWSSWMMSTQDTHIYFAGDTGCGEHFKEIAAKFPSIDIALMPIAPTTCQGENKRKHYHVDAPDAVDAFIDLNAKCFIPMHYGTFFSGEDTLIHPVNRLHAYWQEKLASSDKKLLMARCGEQYLI